MKKEPGFLIRKSAEWYKENPAFVYKNQTFSFTEINCLANRFGSGLKQIGVQQGERVGVLAYNTPELVQCWFGMEKFNIVRTLLHSHFPISTHSGSLNEVEASGIVFDVDFSAEVESILDDIPNVRHFIAIGPMEKTPHFAVNFVDVIEKGLDREPLLTVDENTPCHIQYSSGTTGVPKPWVCTYRSWQFVTETNLSQLNTVIDKPLCDEDVNMHIHPLQWASGFQTFYPYFVSGCKTVLVDDRKLDIDEVLRTISKHRVSGTFVPAPLFSEILDSPNLHKYQYESLKRVILFFANKSIIDQARSVFGEVFISGFGSTEQGALITRLKPSEYVDALNEGNDLRRESVGRPSSPFVEIEVVDENRNFVKAGETGEIVVRSPMSSNYYFNRPDLTEGAFLPGKWFKTGDIGFLDEEGYMYFSDRAKDRIFTNGGVVYPHLVEEVILQHPSIANVGVIGVKVDNEKEKLTACVQLKNANDSGIKNNLKEQLLELCRIQLKGYEIPSDIEFINEIPTVLGGAKVQRSELRKMFVKNIQ